jgi:hypothetical protein
MDWETYLGHLDTFASQAEDALSRGEVFSWPDLALPGDRPTPDQRRRAVEVHARMAAVLDSARERRGELAKELTRLATAGHPPHRTADVLGSSLDVTG